METPSNMTSLSSKSALRFSVRQLLALVSVTALFCAIGIPASRFYFFDRVDFNYDKKQTEEFVSTYPKREILLQKIEQMTIWNRNDFLIVFARATNSSLGVTWLTANVNLPDSLIIKLDSGLELSFPIQDEDINPSGTYLYFAEIPLEGKKLVFSEIQFVWLTYGNEKRSAAFNWPSPEQ